jgi:hypothetical protein
MHLCHRDGQGKRRGVLGATAAIAAAVTLAALSAMSGGCIAGASDKRLLGFTPDGKTLVYCTNDRIFIGVVLGMHAFGCGPQSIYLDWCDVNSPERVRRLKLYGGVWARAAAGMGRDVPHRAQFSPDSRHLTVEWDEKLLLVDLKTKATTRIAAGLPCVGRWRWLSSDELIVGTTFGPSDGRAGTRRFCLCRCSIHQPAAEPQRVYEHWLPCWTWSLSPDRSHVLIGPYCCWGQCTLLDLESGSIRRFGPPRIRLGEQAWTSDGSAVFCELKHPPDDPTADPDAGARQYLLVSTADPERILASHREAAPLKMGYLLRFAPGDEYVVTSRCLLIRPRSWKVIDLTDRLRKRGKPSEDWQGRLDALPVPGWLCLWGTPGDTTYAVDCWARTFVPIAKQGRYAVSPDGKYVAEVISGPLEEKVNIRRLDLPPAPGEAAPAADGARLHAIPRDDRQRRPVARRSPAQSRHREADDDKSASQRDRLDQPARRRRRRVRAGAFGPRQAQQLGQLLKSRRMWMGRGRQHALLDIACRRPDRDHAGADHALLPAGRTRRQGPHLRRD